MFERLRQRVPTPSFDEATEWLNPEPLGPAELRVALISGARLVLHVLNGQTGVLPAHETTGDLRRAPPQRRLRADGMLAQVDGRGTGGTNEVPGQRHRSGPGRRPEPAALDRRPQIEQLGFASLQPGPRFPGIE